MSSKKEKEIHRELQKHMCNDCAGIVIGYEDVDLVHEKFRATMDELRLFRGEFTCYHSFCMNMNTYRWLYYAGNSKIGDL